MANKLKKELSLIEAICISSGVMISSGLFILPAIAYTKAGASIILSYIIGSLLIIPTILSKAELVTAIPVTGGIYVYADRSMGPLVGTLAGLTAWISLAFKSAFSLLAMGMFVVLVMPDISVLQMKLIAVAWCVIFTIINIRGVKLSGVFQAFFVIILIIILTGYSAVGLFSIRIERYIPFTPMGVGAIFATAGLIFISFSGTTKITAIAGEVKNPARNLPLAIFYSWGIVSVLYALVVFVTVGLLEPAEIASTFTPITLGGGKILGRFGILLMTIAALLAFISTGNAGLLAASRNPLAMGKDELLPGFFNEISSKGTPVISIISTSAIMIAVILFLDIENFVKTASALKLILFIIANLALIFMREANIHHYRPKYKAPFYPWAQIFGILSYGFLLTQMGKTPLIIVTIFIICGIGWFYLYAYGKIKREYAILHIIERATGIKATDQLLEEELRDILIERDDITHKWFHRLIRKIPVIEIQKPVPADKIIETVAKQLKERTKTDEEKLYNLIAKRLHDPEIILKPGVACFSVKIPGRRRFEFLTVRNKEGVKMTESSEKIYALFIVVYSNDEWNFQIHALSRIIDIAEREDFLDKWLSLSSSEEAAGLLLKLYNDTICHPTQINITSIQNENNRKQ